MLELLVIYQETGTDAPSNPLVGGVGPVPGGPAVASELSCPHSRLSNAVRQLKMLDEEWPLMDQVIERPLPSNENRVNTSSPTLSSMGGGGQAILLGRGPFWRTDKPYNRH